MIGLTAAPPGHGLAPPCHARAWTPGTRRPTFARMEAAMKIRPTFFGALAAAVAAAPCLAAPTAVERQGIVIQGGIIIEGGLTFTKQITLNDAVIADGSARLEKGTYDVHFESMPGNKVRATFFQGGLRKGEAVGIAIIKGAPAAVGGAGGKTQTGPGAGPHTATFAQLGLGPASAHSVVIQGGKMNLTINGNTLNGGTNQILIGLLLPAVSQQRGIIAVEPAQKR